MIDKRGTSHVDIQLVDRLASGYFILRKLTEGLFDTPEELDPDIDYAVRTIGDTVKSCLSELLKLRRGRDWGDRKEEIAVMVALRYQRMFHYEFSEGDLKILQTKINELRDVITAAPYMDNDFRVRLLSKLEKLQAELHKKMSNVDRFWGLFGDAGVAIGKFGTGATPLFDRIREILEIVWRTQARANELPSNIPIPEIEHKQSR